MKISPDFQNFVSVRTGRQFDPDHQLRNLGLLKEKADSGVNRESAFLFSADFLAVVNGDDQRCERFQNSDASNLDSCSIKTDSQRFLSSLKKGDWTKPLESALKIFLCGIIWIILTNLSVTAFCSTTTELTAANSVYFKGINVEALASAIKRAENSATKPYGILKDYCSPQNESACRKGCIQTIHKRLRLWDGSGDFITYLGKSYCPPKAHKLNQNWTRNVSFFYHKEAANGK